ncbi:MAG: hypothetical protein E7Z63_06120 [Thermoplasmata archaeon]|nr:hypothetical protein [Thermoplasmata archaeon]
MRFMRMFEVPIPPLSPTETESLSKGETIITQGIPEGGCFPIGDLVAFCSWVVAGKSHVRIAKRQELEYSLNNGGGIVDRV